MPVACSVAFLPLILCLALGVPGDLPAQQRAPVPDAPAREASQKAAGEIYAARFRQAKTVAERTALAMEMIEAAGKLQDGVPDQYVLLKIAADIAAGAGDAPTALQAVEEMVARFDVPDVKLAAETLLTTAGNASLTSQHAAVGEAVLTIVDAMADADEYELALRLCELARSSAQRTRQFALAKELATKIEDLERRQGTAREYHAARAVLEKDPTDPAANLAAGRYLCFVAGQWDRGVAMLALGSDADLKAVAVKDLRGANSAEEQAVIGDAWWDVAQGRDDAERDALLQRAGFWYQQAEPTLRGGLVGLKLKERLTELEKTGREAPAPPVAGARLQVPAGAVLLMTFEPETFTSRDGKLYVADLSGFGHHGLVEGAKLIPAGQAGAALQFDGRASVILPTLAGQLAQDRKELSVSAWAGPADVSGDAIILDVGFFANASISLYRWNDRFRFSLCDIACNSERIEARSWYHVAGVWDGIDQKIYVDGQLVARVPNVGLVLDATSIATGHGARIGGQAKAPYRDRRYFRGLIDEVAIFDRALSEAEIQTLLQLGKRGEPLVKAARTRAGR